MGTIIELTNVVKGFRRSPVLDGVNFAVEEGTCCSVQGPNGSGKSVLFKLIARLMRPDQGSVRIDPRYLGPRAVFPRFGIVIDRPGYLPSRTGLENLQLLASIQRLVDDAEIMEAMRRVGLDPNLPQKVRDYSLGMKQKLALAQAFMEGQRVLILDEPFNALDETSVTEVHALLQSFVSDGRTIVFSSHNQQDVDLLSGIRYRIVDRRLIRVD